MWDKVALVVYVTATLVSIWGLLPPWFAFYSARTRLWMLTALIGTNIFMLVWAGAIRHGDPLAEVGHFVGFLEQVSLIILPVVFLYLVLLRLEDDRLINIREAVTLPLKPFYVIVIWWTNGAKAGNSPDEDVPPSTERGETS